jgi:hypothetical protein
VVARRRRAAILIFLLSQGNLVYYLYRYCVRDKSKRTSFISTFEYQILLCALYGFDVAMLLVGSSIESRVGTHPPVSWKERKDAKAFARIAA